MKRFCALVAVILFVLLAAPACVRHVHVHQPAPPHTTPPPDPTPAGAGAEVEMFYDDLAPDGTWVRVEGPGWVWYPRGVAAGWRPYVEGRWVYTDYGWTWVSDESWGWAAYHYGRWHHTPRYGWVWVPGTDWGPAWVTWHAGGDWVGWAPLPWGVEWRAGVGLDWGRVDMRAAINPAWWCFVPTRHLASPAPRSHFAPASRNVTIIRITKNVTHYTVVDSRIFNQGVSVKTVSRASGRPVDRYRVKEVAAPRGARGHRMEGEDLVVRRAAPRRAGPGAAKAPRPARERSESAEDKPARHHPPDDRGRRQNEKRAVQSRQPEPPQAAAPPQPTPPRATPPEATPPQAAAPPQAPPPPQAAAQPSANGAGKEAPPGVMKPKVRNKPGKPGVRGAKPAKENEADGSRAEDESAPKSKKDKSTRSGSHTDEDDRP